MKTVSLQIQEETFKGNSNFNKLYGEFELYNTKKYGFQKQEKT